MKFSRFEMMRTAARIMRYHTMPPIHRQTVGEHTFGVLTIILEVESFPSSELLRAALYHDATEALLGDTPSPAKWFAASLEGALKVSEESIKKAYAIDINLSEHDKMILKYADLMELVVFCLEEADDGNRKMLEPARDCLRAIEARGLRMCTPEANRLWTHMNIRSQAYDNRVITHYRTTHARPSYDLGVVSDDKDPNYDGE